jgi:hypothetical protein
MQKLDNFTRESRLRFAVGAVGIAILVSMALLVLSFVGGSIH